MLVFRSIPLAMWLAATAVTAAVPPWKSAVATYETATGPVSAAIDGIFSPENGWSVQGGHMTEQSAIFISTAPLDAAEWQIQLSCFSTEPRAYPVRFEVAVTRDPAPSFESEWVILKPNRTILLRESDHENVAFIERATIILGETGPSPAVAVRAPSPFPRVTAFRLNLVPGISVSQAGSVTLNPAGACTITEFEITADPLRSTNIATGRPVIASSQVEDSLPAAYLTDGFANTFSRPKSALKNDGFHFDIDLGRAWPIHHLVVRSRNPNAHFPPATMELLETRESAPDWNVQLSNATHATVLSPPHPLASRWIRLAASNAALEGNPHGAPEIAEVEVYPLLQPFVLRWSADGHLLERNDAPPATRQLHFELSAPAPVPLDAIHAIRYRLPGWQGRWQVTDASRGITLASPPPGDYRIELQALHSDGQWDDSGQPFAFTIPPLWWQTRGFLPTLVAILILAGLLGGRQLAVLRLNRRLAEARHENAMQRERLRIARDMHDDIGARLTHLAFLAEASEHDPPGDGKPFARIADEARETVASLDQIVWAVNPRNDTIGGFSEYLSNYAGSYLSSTGIRLREDIAVTHPRRPMGFETRHALLMACKEALQNLAKHSGANEVRLAVHDTGGRLLLVIQDNGRGLPDSTEAPDHSGLDNMRERLAEAGGTCNIASSPSTGTTVTFTLPLAKTSDDRH